MHSEFQKKKKVQGVIILTDFTGWIKMSSVICSESIKIKK